MPAMGFGKKIKIKIKFDPLRFWWKQIERTLFFFFRCCCLVLFFVLFISESPEVRCDQKERNRTRKFSYIKCGRGKKWQTKL